MGKVKIPIMFEKDAALRKKRFNDRKRAAVNKVKELGKLTGANMLLLIQNTEADDILCVSSMDHNLVKDILPKAGFKGKLQYEKIPDPNPRQSNVPNSMLNNDSNINGYSGSPFCSSAAAVPGCPSSLSYGFPIPSSSAGVSQPQPQLQPQPDYGYGRFCATHRDYAYLNHDAQDSMLSLGYGQVFAQGTAASNSHGVSTVETAAARGNFQNSLVGVEHIQEVVPVAAAASVTLTPVLNSDWAEFDHGLESARILGGKAPVSVADADPAFTIWGSEGAEEQISGFPDSASVQVSASAAATIQDLTSSYNSFPFIEELLDYDSVQVSAAAAIQDLTNSYDSFPFTEGHLDYDSVQVSAAAVQDLTTSYDSSAFTADLLD